MLIYRYCIKQTTTSVIAVLGVLSVVFIGNQFVRLLGAAAAGKFPIEVVWEIMLYSLPHFIAMLMPLSVFLGILMSYSKLYAELEATAMISCGVSPSYFIRVTLVPALLFSSLAACCTLLLSPMGLAEVSNIKQQMRANAQYQAISPGKFHTMSKGSRVIFVEEGSPKEKKLRNFFMVSHFDSPKEQVVTAKNGAFNFNPNDEGNYLALKDGYRYGSVNTADYSSTQGFSEFGIRLYKPSVAFSRGKINTVDTFTLYFSEDPVYQAEWHWRTGIPVSILILSFIAVPLGKVNPRQGRFAKFFPAILLYFGYFVLMTSSRGLIEDALVPQSIGMWWVHLLLFAVAVSLYGAGNGVFNKLLSKKRNVECID